MADVIPQWAVERAQDLTSQMRGGFGCFHAFAAYIAAHEEPPVDPLLIEARKLVAARPGNCDAYSYSILSGNEDNGQAVQNALTAIKRGIELTKSITPMGESR